jgi:hypothetical protein
LGGRKYLTIPPGKELDETVFSISFWFFWSKVDAEGNKKLTGIIF